MLSAAVLLGALRVKMSMKVNLIRDCLGKFSLDIFLFQLIVEVIQIRDQILHQVAYTGPYPMATVVL